MKLDLLKFKKANLTKNRVSFTANPCNYSGSTFIPEISRYHGNYHKKFGPELNDKNFGLDFLYRDTDSSLSLSQSQFLNTGIFYTYSPKQQRHCYSHSKKFLVGHDILFFDIDSADHAYVMYDKLTSYSIPYTCVVDTGNDGRVHIVVALDKVISYRELDRKKLAEKMRVIFTHYRDCLIDLGAFENPTAFVRVPGAYRIDTEAYQSCVVGKGTGEIVSSETFLKAIDRAHKRKLREGRKVAKKNRGVNRTRSYAVGCCKQQNGLLK